MKRVILVMSFVPLGALAVLAACAYGPVACSAYVARSQTGVDVYCESEACGFSPEPVVACFEEETAFAFDPPRLMVYVYPEDTDLDGDPSNEGAWFGYMSERDVIHTTSARNLVHELEHARLWRQTGDPDPTHAVPPGAWDDTTDAEIDRVRGACVEP